MKLSLGVSLVIAGVAIVLAMAGGAWWWWNHNAEKILESGTAAVAEGQQAGSALRESGCVAKAAERHRVDENRTLLGSVRTGLYLRGCLDSSKAEAAFCEGVPAKGDILSMGMWAAQSCAKLGFTDSYCSQLFTQISEYCFSSERAAKLKPPAVKP